MSSAGAADAGSSRWRIRAISAFIGLTTRKNTAAAMVTNVITACRNAPYRKSALLIEKCRSTSPDSPANIEISGETKAVTNVWTSCVNAVPITIATASSSTLPRRTKSRNSFSTPETCARRISSRRWRTAGPRSAYVRRSGPQPRRDGRSLHARGRRRERAPRGLVRGRLGRRRLRVVARCRRAGHVRSLGGQAAAGAELGARRRARALRARRPPPRGRVRVAWRLRHACRAGGRDAHRRRPRRGRARLWPARAPGPGCGRRACADPPQLLGQARARPGALRARGMAGRRVPGRRPSTPAGVARRGRRWNRRPGRGEAVDGCGMRTFALPLRALAAAFGRLAGGELGAHGDRVASAMASNPQLVRYAGTIDTELMAGGEGRLGESDA